MPEEISKEKRMLLYLDYIIRYWNDGIFSEDEAASRCLFAFYEYQKEEKDGE
jgi:hypothetical protein